MAKYEKFLTANDEEKKYHDWRLFLGDTARILTDNGWQKGKITEFCRTSITIVDENEIEYVIFLDNIKDVDVLHGDYRG